MTGSAFRSASARAASSRRPCALNSSPSSPSTTSASSWAQPAAHVHSLDGPVEARRGHQHKVLGVPPAYKPVQSRGQQREGHAGAPGHLQVDRGQQLRAAAAALEHPVEHQAVGSPGDPDSSPPSCPIASISRRAPSSNGSVRSRTPVAPARRAGRARPLRPPGGTARRGRAEADRQAGGLLHTNGRRPSPRPSPRGSHDRTPKLPPARSLGRGRISSQRIRFCWGTLIQSPRVRFR